MAKNQSRKFLSSLLNSFGRLAGRNPTGRILSRCYAHAILTEPKLAKCILGEGYDKQNRNLADLAAEVEYSFIGKKRRADLRLVSDNRTVALAEIKVEDQHSDGEYRQLKDYVNFANTDLPFYYITKYPLSDTERKILQGRHTHRRHYEIAASLSEQTSEVAQMIAAYMRDQNMAGYQPLNVTESDLRDFVRRILPSGQYWPSTKDAPARISQIMEQCLNNAMMISTWLADGNRTKLKFSVYPTVNSYSKLEEFVKDHIPKLPGKPNIRTFKAFLQEYETFSREYNEVHKNVAKLEGDISDYFDGGEVYFVAEGRFRTKPPMWLSASIWVRVTEKNKLESGILVEIEGRVLRTELEDKTIWKEKLVTLKGYGETNLRRDLGDLIDKAQIELAKLQKHKNAKLRSFSKSKTARTFVNMKFLGLGH